jgi:hypothetical protein
MRADARLTHSGAKRRPRRGSAGGGGEALEVRRPARPRAGAARPSEALARRRARTGDRELRGSVPGRGHLVVQGNPGLGRVQVRRSEGTEAALGEPAGWRGQAKLWRPSDWRRACEASGVACSDKCGSPATAVSSRGARTSETYLCARRASTGQGGSRGRARSTCAGRPTACCVARAACEGVARARTGQRSSP